LNKICRRTKARC